MSGNTTELQDRVSGLVGKECWYVSAGGSAGSRFILDLGGKEPLGVSLDNKVLPEESRHFRGESTLFVTCCWRLDGPDGAITSSYINADAMALSLKVLVGEKVSAVAVYPPAWDLSVEFTGGLVLEIFCDNLESGFTNWSMRTGRGAKPVSAGPGYQWKVEESG